ncbi:MAG: aryl-sulfate sulfotransferase, partial [Anaerolineales bacterium]
QFKFINGQPFAYQHDVRQLPNGDITVFDNQGTQQNPAPSHAIEYKIDVANKTATQMWEYTHTPPVFATFMGNTQRLADGNTFMDWGAPSTADGYKWVTMTEVNPDNQTVFELTFDQPYVSYRAFRFPWQGSPDTLPDLAFKADASGITLGYSWNGATDVASYNVLGGSSPQALSQIETKDKTDFETQSHLTNLAQGECYYQVAALDERGKELARSKVISTDPATCPLAQ